MDILKTYIHTDSLSLQCACSVLRVFFINSSTCFCIWENWKLQIEIHIDILKTHIHRYIGTRKLCSLPAACLQHEYGVHSAHSPMTAKQCK